MRSNPLRQGGAAVAILAPRLQKSNAVSPDSEPWCASPTRRLVGKVTDHHCDDTHCATSDGISPRHLNPLEQYALAKQGKRPSTTVQWERATTWADRPLRRGRRYHLNLLVAPRKRQDLPIFIALRAACGNQQSLLPFYIHAPLPVKSGTDGVDCQPAISKW